MQLLAVWRFLILMALVGCFPQQVAPTLPEPSVPAPSDTLSIQLLDASGTRLIEGRARAKGASGASFFLKPNSEGLFFLDPEQLPLEILFEHPSQRSLRYFLEPSDAIKDTTRLSFVLAQKGAVQKGMLIDEKGQPVSRAQVVSAAGTVLSDEKGIFELEAQPGEQVHVFRQGYLPWSGTVQDQMILKNKSFKLGVLTAYQSLGGDFEDAPLQYFSNALAERAELQKGALSVLSKSCDILFLISPLKALSEQEQQELHAFIDRGGKLIVTSEWAGYSGENTAALNAFLLPLGLFLEGDALHLERSDVVFSEHFVFEGLTEVRFIQTGSLSRLNTEDNEILAWSQPGYQIQTKGSRHGLIALGYHGLGKVALIADSSWLTDVPDHGLKSGDHLRLLNRLIDW